MILPSGDKYWTLHKVNIDVMQARSLSRVNLCVEKFIVLFVYIEEYGIVTLWRHEAVELQLHAVWASALGGEGVQLYGSDSWTPLATGEATL